MEKRIKSKYLSFLSLCLAFLLGLTLQAPCSETSNDSDPDKYTRRFYSHLIDVKINVEYPHPFEMFETPDGLSGYLPKTMADKEFFTQLLSDTETTKTLYCCNDATADQLKKTEPGAKLYESLFSFTYQPFRTWIVKEKTLGYLGMFSFELLHPDNRVFNTPDEYIPQLSNRRHCNFAIAVLKEHQGQGWGYKITRAALQHIFGRTTAQTLIWGALETNIASCKLAEKCGFTRKGELRSKEDHQPELFYTLNIEDWEAQHKNSTRRKRKRSSSRPKPDVKKASVPKHET